MGTSLFCQTQKTYDRLLELGITLARESYTVILDAKYDRVALRQAVIAQSQTEDISSKIIHFTAPMKVLCDALTSVREISQIPPPIDLIASQQINSEAFTEEE